MTRVIDAHQHFWERGRFKDAWLDLPEHAPISGSFGPADLAPLLREAGVDGSVFVQTQHDLEENRWALTLADANPWILGVVGWVDLASPKVEDQLREFRAHKKFVGVRHLVQDEPDDGFILRDDVGRGLRVLERLGVPYDLLFLAKHLKHAAVLARRFPGLRMAIDHLSKPRIRDGGLAGWREELKAAAGFPNVYCKLSGMATEADRAAWTPKDLEPFVDVALEAFGPARLMYGSDWPVCLLAAPYARVKSTLDGLIARLSPAERTKILGGSAERFYALPE
jgi:L-fuconolactonase